MAPSPRPGSVVTDVAALERMLRLYTQEGMTQADLARRFDRRPSWVAAQLRRMMPSSSQALVSV